MTFFNRPNYNTPEFKALRFATFKRDEFKCALCNSKGKKLNCHHIKPVAKFPELELVSTNLITICEECHENKVNGHEAEFEHQFTEFVQRKLIVSGGMKKGRKPSYFTQGKYKPRNSRLRF